MKSSVTAESKLDGHFVLSQLPVPQTQPPPGITKAAPVLVPWLPVLTQLWPGSIQAITPV